MCSRVRPWSGFLRLVSAWLAALFLVPSGVYADEPDWSVGGYLGRYYDTEPAGLTHGRANFLDHYLVALTASTTIWRPQAWPLAIEVDGMIGQQSGLGTLSEVAIAPALRFSGFPWRNTLRTDLRLAPLGISYTSSISPLERGPDGQGSRTLNFLFIELAVSRPTAKENEYFLRMHHRCTIYDRLNNYGANGEDFLALGYRYRF